MLQIAICDNEPLHCKELTRYVEHTVQYRQANIRTFQKSKQLLDLIHQQKYAPHIAVIEVCMPDTDGITLAKYINELLPNCQIIFFTSYLSFALDVYSANHVYFILEQQLPQRIGPAMELALSNLQKKYAQIQVQKLNSFFVIPVSEIQYVERTQRKTQVITTSDLYFSGSSPSELIGACELFVRCHQSYWVNLKYVLGMENGCFHMQCGAHIPISRSYQHEARTFFFRSALITTA